MVVYIIYVVIYGFRYDIAHAIFEIFLNSGMIEMCALKEFTVHILDYIILCTQLFSILNKALSNLSLVCFLIDCR